jgi:nucleoside-diphosphate-sugar epimerase
VQRKPAIEQAAAVLDWRPTTTLDVGLARTVDYFRAGLVG